MSGDADVYAYDLDPGAWDDLRAHNSRDHHLRLACCGSQVTLKTSKLGTRFFAHARRGDCSSGPETAEHLFVKAEIAKAIGRTRWRAATEVRSSAPDGMAWIADVLATQGNRRVAFEVQWSPQPHDESVQRQARLQRSGVRGLWLFRRPSDIQVSRALPSVLLDVDLNPPAASVRLPATALCRTPQNAVLRRTGHYWAQTIELSRFVRGCLSGALVWAPGLNQRVPLELWAAEDDCWKCRQRTAIITTFKFRVDLLVPGARPVLMNVADFDTSVGRKCLSDALGQADLHAHGIGIVRRRFSRTRGSSYLSNGCVHCDALQGAFFEHEIAMDAEPVLTVHCEMAQALFENTDGDSPFLWCFDERFDPPT